MNPERPHRIFLLILATMGSVIFFPSVARAQNTEQVRDIRNYFDRSYGSDYNLLNGRRYYLYYSSNSHPFLSSEQSQPGDLILGGIPYHGVPINYDLYQQELLLQYISQSGETRQVILNSEQVDEFVLEGKVFRKISFEGRDRGYAQVIRADELEFYIFYSKKLNYTPSMNTTPYHYTKLAKHIYLERDGTAEPVGSRGTFLQQFDPGNRQAIKQYMKQQRIRLKKASDDALTGLLRFCDQLEGEGP
ncbi:MAG: hypothetical protein ACWGNV_04990 [Bacteroidales bacterium]